MLAPHRPALRQPLRFFVFSFGVACLCLAAIHAFTLNAMPASADGLLHFIGGLALAVLVYGLPWTFPNFQNDVAADDIADLQRFK